MLVSAQALIVTLFGGVGTLWGPVIGASILIPLDETLQAKLGDVIPGIQGVVYGVADHPRDPARARGRVLARARSCLRATRAARQQPAAGRPRQALRPLRVRLLQQRSRRTAAARSSDLSKSFGGLQAVEDVSFTVRRRRRSSASSVPNGAGKTTLFNLLNGFLRPDRGRVAVRRAATWSGSSRTASAGWASAARSRSCARSRACRCCTTSWSARYVATRSDAEALAARAQARSSASGSRRARMTPASALTNQELRLMELARALARRPRAAAARRDPRRPRPAARSRSDRVIRSLAAGGTTIVIIEHTMQAMVRLADELLVLDHGRVLAIAARRRR